MPNDQFSLLTSIRLDSPAIVGRLTFCEIDSGEWHDKPPLITGDRERQAISASNWAVVRMECAKVGQLTSRAACIAARLKAAVASLTSVT